MPRQPCLPLGCVIMCVVALPEALLVIAAVNTSEAETPV